VGFFVGAACNLKYRVIKSSIPAGLRPEIRCLMILGARFSAFAGSLAQGSVMNPRHTIRTASREDDVSPPQIIPALKLEGARAERLKTVEAAIARLERLRNSLGGGALPPLPSGELYGRHINAPVWPWFAAGWLLGALFALAFLLAGIFA
jgi:hypothetical protein